MADEAEAELEIDVFGRAVVPAGTESAEAEDLAPALEAVCFALNRPLTLAEAGELLGAGQAAISRAAAVLADQLSSRGLMLQRHSDAMQLVTRPETAWAVQRALNPERPTRLSKPAMETLAIIAYRQPVTRAVIESLRGVNCEAVLDHLEQRGLIAEMGRQETPGRPRIFGTTLRFLQYAGLEHIGELPPLPDGVEVPDLDAAALEAEWR